MALPYLSWVCIHPHNFVPWSRPTFIYVEYAYTHFQIYLGELHLRWLSIKLLSIIVFMMGIHKSNHYIQTLLLVLGLGIHKLSLLYIRHG